MLYGKMKKKKRFVCLYVPKMMNEKSTTLKHHRRSVKERRSFKNRFKYKKKGTKGKGKR